MPGYAGYLPPRHPQRAPAAKVPKAMKRKPKPAKAQPKYDLSKPMKQLVTKEINKNEETNERFYQTRLLHLPNQPTTTSELMRVFPEVFQSGQEDPATGDVYPSNRETRQGTKIRSMNLKVRGRAFIPVGQDLENQNNACISCRLLILSCKKYGKYEDVFSNWDAGSELYKKILKNGSKAVAFDGYQFGLNLPVNDELFTTHHDTKFLLNRGCVFERRISPLPTDGNGLGLVHSPFVVHYFSKNVKCKNKIIKFADETSSFPTNFAPFAVMLWSYTNDAAPSGTELPKIQIQSNLRWKNM